MKKVTWQLLSLFIVAAMLLAACGGAAQGPAAPSEGGLPKGDGKVVIYGGYGEAQAAAFQKALTEFGQAMASK